MAAMLERPLHPVDDAEGTAVGAAALGLLAVGRARELAEAVAQLSPSAGGGSPPVDVDPELVATYDRLRASVPGLIRSLAPVADLFAPQRTRHAPTP